MNSRSYYPSYYSIDDIFVTQEKIPCITEQNLSKLGENLKKYFELIVLKKNINFLGFLDTSSEGADLKQNQKVDLPLWYILQIQKERGRNQFFKWVSLKSFFYWSWEWPNWKLLSSALLSSSIYCFPTNIIKEKKTSSWPFK